MKKGNPAGAAADGGFNSQLLITRAGSSNRDNKKTHSDLK
jgi:hypothetical protein